MKQKKIEELIDSYKEEIHLKEQEEKDIMSLEASKEQVKDIKMSILAIKQNKLQAEIDLRNIIMDSNKTMLQTKIENQKITDKEYSEKIGEIDRYLEVQNVADKIEEIDLDIQLNNTVITYGDLESTAENKFEEIRVAKKQEKEILMKKFYEKMRLYKISTLREKRDNGELTSEDYFEKSRLVRECEEFSLSEVEGIFKNLKGLYSQENPVDIIKESVQEVSGNEVVKVEHSETETQTQTQTETQSDTLTKTKKFVVPIYDKDVQSQLGKKLQDTTTALKVDEVSSNTNCEVECKPTETLINNFFNEVRKNVQESLTANNLGRRTINSPIKLKREINKQIENNINLAKKEKEE